MTPEATLWAEAQQVPLAACPECMGPGTAKQRGMSHGEVPGVNVWTPCKTCWDGTNGTGEVRSDVYRAIERAETVPDARCVQCGHYEAEQLIHDRPDLHSERHAFDGTGRVVRPQPGVMACPEKLVGVTDPGATPLHAACKTCGGSGTVPDPSEAGVVARLQAFGLFFPVYDALVEAGLSLGLRTVLLDALDRRDYGDTLAATLAAVLALVPQEVT